MSDLDLTNLAPMSPKEVRLWVDNLAGAKVYQALQEIVGEPLWGLVSKHLDAHEKRVLLFDLILETRQRMQAAQ